MLLIDDDDDDDDDKHLLYATNEEQTIYVDYYDVCDGDNGLDVNDNVMAITMMDFMLFLDCSLLSWV